MPRYRRALALCILCAGIALGLLVRATAAGSPYVIDGIALGAPWQEPREYQCGASEQFAAYTWCRRERREKGRQGSFASATATLHAHGGSIAYVSREIRPAFFARNDVAAEINRLSARFGVRPRETRLPEQEDFRTAVIALWGELELKLLDGASLEASEAGAPSEQSLLVDHLGDVRKSLRLGLPVYRLEGGPGYLWLATAERSGRGYLRFLAVDMERLAAPKDVAPPAPAKEVAMLPASKHPTPVPPAKSVVALAAADLRPFLDPQPTLAAPAGAGRQMAWRGADARQQSIVQRTRADADRARIEDAERTAAEEKEKAQLAWARFEAQKAEQDADARLQWTFIALLLSFFSVLALLWIITRPRGQPAVHAS
jgi:hypothetical protein